MGLAAGGFTLCSLNLLYLFQANFNLIATYGAMAAFDGGILQFIEVDRLGLSRARVLCRFRGLPTRGCCAASTRREKRTTKKTLTFLGSKGGLEGRALSGSIRPVPLLFIRLPLLEGEAHGAFAAHPRRE